jgi:DNA-binding PadR family transcriptional regulator
MLQLASATLKERNVYTIGSQGVHSVVDWQSIVVIIHIEYREKYRSIERDKAWREEWEAGKRGRSMREGD